MTGEQLEPDVRRPVSERSVARWLAVAAVLGVLAGALITLTALGTRTVPPESADSVWRTAYDRGWAWLVESQHGDPRPDELARASCRWWVDGAGRAVIEQRAVFVAGCDTAARMTPLEAP